MSSAKRKPVQMQPGPAHKRAQFASSGSCAFGGFQKSKSENSKSFLTNGIQRKSNNRREWMKECLKLLEAMTEREESKPFKEPVDCLRFPEFYSSVDEPIDLSKVMLKFRGGQYQDPFEFEKDVRQLFHDYQAFFKEKVPEVYDKCCTLNKWFNEEFQKILTKYGDKLKKKIPEVSTAGEGPAGSSQNTNITVSINHGSCTILQSNEGNVRPEAQGSATFASAAWQQPDELSNSSLTSQQQMLSHYLRMVPTPYTAMLYPPPTHVPLEVSPRRSPYMESALHVMHRKALSEGEFDGQQNKESEPRLPQQNSLPLPVQDEMDFLNHGGRDLSPFRHYRPRLTLTATESSCGGSSGSRSRSISPRPPMDHGSMSQSASPHRGQSESGKKEKKGSSSSCSKSTVGMELEKCTVWFGNVKTKCQRPVVIHENGIKMACTYEGQVYNIKLRPDELIRCSAQLGPTKRHILFFFVLPNFLSRLCDMIPDLFTLLDHRSHLVVLFTPPLSMMQISRLVHIFHCMQRGSPFGNLFSEINQQTALELISNIKPDLKKVSLEQKKRSLLYSCHKGHSSSTETEDEGGGMSVAMARSQMESDWEHSSQGEPSKAYKPKFHFRRQKVIPKQSSASSEPDLSSALGVRHPSLDENRSRSLQTEDKSLPGLEVDSDLELDFDLEDDDDQKFPRSFVLNSSVVEEDMNIDPTEESEETAITLKKIPSIEEPEGPDVKPFDISSSMRALDTRPSELNMANLRMSDMKVPDPKMMGSGNVPFPQCVPVRNIVCGHYYDEQCLVQYLKDTNLTARCPVEGCTSQKPLNLQDLRYDNNWRPSSISTGQ